MTSSATASAVTISVAAARPLAQADSAAPPSLRPYQRAAVGAVLDRFRAGDRATLLVLPTGCGKTVAFAELARLGVEHRRRILVLAHRTELLEQALAKLHAVGVDAAIEQGDRLAGDVPVAVASVQTLRGRRLERFPPDAFQLVIVDECHHAPAATYRAILDHFASARILGVTATPDRGDGEALGGVFQSVAYRYELRQAIRDRWLAPIRVRRIVIEGVDLARIHTTRGDLDQLELAQQMLAERALHGVVQPMLTLSRGRRTILFAVDVAHAHALAEVCNRYEPGVARAVDGRASAADRAAALVAFRAGEFRVLINCCLYVEGFDEPSIACVAIARPTKSRALYTQMIGRGTRVAAGKTDVLVLDFAGNAGRHRLIGPEDALAGRVLDADLRADVAALLNREPDQSLDAALDEAEAVAHERRTRIRVTAVTRFREEAIDPFVELAPPPTGPWVHNAATPAQRQALERAGLRHLPDELTKGEAFRWLGALAARREAGLSSFRQTRLLRKFGVDARQMRFAEASARIIELKENGWRRWW